MATHSASYYWGGWSGGSGAGTRLQAAGAPAEELGLGPAPTSLYPLIPAPSCSLKGSPHPQHTPSPPQLPGQQTTSGPHNSRCHCFPTGVGMPAPPSVLTKSRHGGGMGAHPGPGPSTQCTPCRAEPLLKRLRSKARWSRTRHHSTRWGPVQERRRGLFKEQTASRTCHQAWPSTPAGRTSPSSHAGAAAQRSRRQGSSARQSGSPWGRGQAGSGSSRGWGQGTDTEVPGSPSCCPRSLRRPSHHKASAQVCAWPEPTKQTLGPMPATHPATKQWPFKSGDTEKPLGLHRSSPRLGTKHPLNR